MIIYAEGDHSDIEVDWDPDTGAVKVLPDGNWLYLHNYKQQANDDPFPT